MNQSQIKYIKSLSRQKYRKAYNAYLVEGSKNAKEWLQSDKTIKIIAALPDWIENHHTEIHKHPEAELLHLQPFELEKISNLSTAQSVLLVVEQESGNRISQGLNEWCLYLEEIKDPGNMGTILRIADWFGIRTVYYSENCVEIYNPKVVQATMGSLLRVNTVFCPVNELLDLVSERKIPLYAAAIEGEDLNHFRGKYLDPGILAMGNESNGLSVSLLEKADYKIKIPGGGGAESLNVGVATGILCAWVTQLQ